AAIGRHLLDPLADAPVELPALRSRECPVDDVARQGVLERELAHPRHAGVDTVGDKAASYERSDHPLVDLDRRRPEAAADPAATAQRIARRSLEPVDARRDHAVYRIRD